MGEKEKQKPKPKVTVMALEVDLQCCRCYKKVKKVLCKFPEIRDQKYDEKANKVTITVVCCSPEKIMDKLCCKGGGCIKSIEIVPPPKPPKPAPAPAPVPPAPAPAPPPPAPAPAPAPPPPAPAPAPPPPPPTPAPAPPPAPPPPICRPPPGFCCTECYHGHSGGPCFYGRPPPRPCYDICGRPVYDSWGCGGGSYRYCYTSSGECFCEESPQGCSIM